MATIVMSVSERRCMAPPGLELVTHNPIDSIQFDFDAEWIEHPARTARFAWHGGFIDVPFIGDTVQVPEIQGTLTLYIGVYADGISSTPAKVPCNLSVKAYGGPQKVPTLSVYDEIIALVSAGIPVYFEDLTEEQKAELVAEFSDDVAALQALTGEGPLTTTAQTLTGAVNELDARAGEEAVLSENFFITPPETLLNEEGVRYSPGLDTAEVPSAPVVPMVVAFQSVGHSHDEVKTTDGNSQKFKINMWLSNASGQPHNQGYQKQIGHAISGESILGKLAGGYSTFYICTVEDCEKYPDGSSTGNYWQRYLFAIKHLSSGTIQFVVLNNPVLTRQLNADKKMYLWKVEMSAGTAQEILDQINAGTHTIQFNGIWNTRKYEGEEPVCWTVHWDLIDYAFTDGSSADADMADFFLRKYAYWENYVNHSTLKKRFADLEEAIELDNVIKITCWGDSLTSMGGWTTTLAGLCGGTVYNAGTGGEGARTIMARQGGDVMTINNITIPATTDPVLIASKSTDGGITTEAGYKVTPLLQWAPHVNPVMIGDIEGTLAWTGSSWSDPNGTWTFTRSEAGDAVVIDRPTAIRTHFDRTHNVKGEIMIIFMGQNGGYDNNLDTLVSMHRKMIDHFKGKEYVVLGLSTGSAASRADYEAAMKAAFGRRFISLREYLAGPIYDESNNIVSCYGLADQNITPDATSLSEIATGTVPHQCLMDGIHYTTGTRTVIGNMLYRKMRELNILP